MLAIFLSLFPDATAADAYATAGKVATEDAITDAKTATPSLLFSGMNVTSFPQNLYAGGTAFVQRWWQSFKEASL